MTGAICALVLTMSSPSRSAADVIAFGRDGAARTSGWTFHGARPAWAGLDKSTEAEVVRASLNATPPSSRDGILSLIRTTADRHHGNRALRQVGLDADDWQVFFQALVEAESSYNPTAVSPKGAYGLGQLMPDTALELGVDPRDPSQNLDGAARYLLAQLATFKDIDLALAAYNAGPHRVVEYSGVPPFTETRDYIARIHRIRSQLAGTHVSAPDIRVATRVPALAPVLIDLQ
ncbi:Soluble lytic murein transglycosylase (plasmid) [Phaeobacter inhibens]|uniref:Soluble lytic murein transglycosylase n=2 Tax=Phaeobacter inhibens TaxID=221822 RepID=A0ABM6RKG0_9RHOB|nr:Soluble lytic murein transglycosylase [Phaeobacter inhibens]AUQ97052.1 Soluble lytic murein transglycosylase [Phaeobacter inhibens]AUR22252.1 Soluble lytic murein transglycosylase [Phaeobacter inhibens]